ncbi:hypothetical protein ACN9MU_16800 [Pseudoduganella sp. R-32]|uniref:hypothetical protein n=1 Tax=unclassified Pseudoduganella TaxID=2637179 RepID=UPI003CF029AA
MQQGGQDEATRKKLYSVGGMKSGMRLKSTGGFSLGNVRVDFDPEYSAGSEISDDQKLALSEGAGPLAADVARNWLALGDDIGPAANGRQLPSSDKQKAESAAVRRRLAQLATDFGTGTGEFAPTTKDNKSLWSAVKDSAKVPWNLAMDAAELGEYTPLGMMQRGAYRAAGWDLPRPAELRAGYETPAFGLSLEFLAPLVPVSRIARIPRTLGGAAFVEGKFVHDLKPLTNLELYGREISRTPDEAVALLRRVGHDADELAGYRFVKLSDGQIDEAEDVEAMGLLMRGSREDIEFARAAFKDQKDITDEYQSMQIGTYFHGEANAWRRGDTFIIIGTHELGYDPVEMALHLEMGTKRGLADMGKDLNSCGKPK